MNSSETGEISDVENVGRLIPGIVRTEEATAKNRDVNEWIRFGMSLGAAAALHPFEYTKTLIQLGYEPIPPVPGRSIFGKPILVLPNVFQYTNYIRKVDGLWGCYTGLTPHIFGLVVSKLTKRYLIRKRGYNYQNALDVDHSDSLEQFKTELKGDVILCAAGAVIVHPFNVISIRMMAQFVGSEHLYTNMITSIREIFRTEGLAGFFNGIIPRLIWDVGCLILTSTTVYLVNKYILQDKVKKHVSLGVVQYVYSNMLYPLHVATTCMCVSGTSLAAGRPPIMPHYNNWIDCLKDLNQRGELKRGNSILLRSTPKIFFKSQQIYSVPPLLKQKAN